MNFEKYLPVGTVVMLKGGKKRVMIMGFTCIDDSNENPRLYDYCGVLYPEGFIASNKNLLFNHDQIEKVFYMGYRDEEEEKFKETLREVVNKVSNQNN